MAVAAALPWDALGLKSLLILPPAWQAWAEARGRWAQAALEALVVGPCLLVWAVAAWWREPVVQQAWLAALSPQEG